MDSDRVAESVKKYTQHNMIQKYTDLPEYPDCRTRLLYTFLRKGSILPDRSELLSVVTSLVQMGLDTHDLVDNETSQLAERQARSRQLKVLGGDYFSGKFYELLAKEGQVEIIKLLSEGICEVNRLKINLYLKMKNLQLDAEEYLSHSVSIKSQLFLMFSRFMEGKHREKWPDILEGFTRCEIILQEISRLESLRSFRFSWGFWHLLQITSKEDRKWLKAEEEEDESKLNSILIKCNIRTHLFQMLDQQLKLVLAKVEKLDSRKMIKELYQIGMPYMRNFSAPCVL